MGYLIKLINIFKCIFGLIFCFLCNLLIEFSFWDDVLIVRIDYIFICICYFCMGVIFWFWVWVFFKKLNVESILVVI